MSTIANLPGRWTILYDPPATLNADGTGYTATVAFETDWSNLAAFVGVVGGLKTSIPIGGGNSITRLVPLQHPMYSGLWANAVACEAFGTPSATLTDLAHLYNHVKVVVTFVSVPYGISGSQAYMQVRMKGSGVYTTIQGRKLVFPGGEVLGQDAGEFVGQQTYSITMYQCPQLNDSILNPLVNNVNSTTFLGYSAGYVLFNSWDGDFSIGIGGLQNYTITCNVTWQSHPWNQFYQSNGVLDTPVDPASNPVFPSADLNQILA